MFSENAHCKDLGPKPSLINLHKETVCNQTFRTAIWTGEHLQLTVMSIPVGGEIGLEIHDVDQLIKVESGCANVYVGNSKQTLSLIGRMNANDAILLPAGTWHNILNACSCPLKLYSVYAPPNHPFGTVNLTKLDADLAEHD